LVESVSKELVLRLSLHLQKHVPGLAQVLNEWPNAGVELKYPSITILTKQPKFTPLSPYLLTKTDIEEEIDAEDAKQEIKYVVGAYEWPLQLDLWTKTKEQRHEFFQKLFLAFNTNPYVPGITTTMVDYHNALARYDLDGFQYQDEEISAQRTEWRVTMNVLSQCKAIVAKDEFAIITTQVSLTPTTDPEEF
jgi:hypothetical protein